MTEQRDPVHGAEALRHQHRWAWRDPFRGEHFKRCSWCGSMNPEELIFEKNARIGWADYKYGWPHKFYIDVLNRDPERPFCVGSASRGSSTAIDQGYIAWEDLTDAQRQTVIDSGMGRENDEYTMSRTYKFGPKRHHFGKFYTVHLKDPAISDAVKDQVQRMSGLRLIWLDDGRVRWEPYA